MSQKVNTNNGDGKATYYEIELSDTVSVRVQPEQCCTMTEIETGIELRVGTGMYDTELHLTQEEASKLKEALDESLTSC